jgi:hypothetical protein
LSLTTASELINNQQRIILTVALRLSVLNPGYPSIALSHTSFDTVAQ